MREVCRMLKCLKFPLFRILGTIFLIISFSLQNLPLSLSQYNSYKFSSHLVESFGWSSFSKQRMPLKQLEKRWSGKVCGIYYLVNSLKDSACILPNEYGLKRYNYLKQKLSIENSGLTLNIVDDQSYWMGWDEGRTVEEKNENWIKEISSLISKSKSNLYIAQKSALINIGPNGYQVIFNIEWKTLPDKETFSRYRYLLFLVADEIHGEDFAPQIGKPIFENLAYDFIPLEGDDPEVFDGSGLPLIFSNRKIPLDDSIMILKTAPFKLPEIKNTGWSLHLIIEDPQNLGKAIFSYKIRLLNA